MSKPTKKDSSEVFTIQFDQVNDSSEIPGIAELLGSKTSGNTKVGSFSGATRSSIATSIKSLKEFGTKLEIHFLLKKDADAYRYHQHNDLSASKFIGLDEFFEQMKVPAQFAKEFGTFGEFKQAEKTYLFDAFGITEQPFLQFVLNQANKVLTVYVSEKSMLAKKDDVVAYTENKNQSLSAGDIELDLAA